MFIGTEVREWTQCINKTSVYESFVHYALHKLEGLKPESYAGMVTANGDHELQRLSLEALSFQTTMSTALKGPVLVTTSHKTVNAEVLVLCFVVLFRNLFLHPLCAATCDDCDAVMPSSARIKA
jgi:hypothetical protein